MVTHRSPRPSLAGTLMRSTRPCAQAWAPPCAPPPSRPRTSARSPSSQAGPAPWAAAPWAAGPWVPAPKARPLQGAAATRAAPAAGGGWRGRARARPFTQETGRCCLAPLLGTAWSESGCDDVQPAPPLPSWNRVQPGVQVPLRNPVYPVCICWAPYSCTAHVTALSHSHYLVLPVPQPTPPRFKAKSTAGGDVKGRSKVEPYAYWQFNRKVLLLVLPLCCCTCTAHLQLPGTCPRCHPLPPAPRCLARPVSAGAESMQQP